MKNSISGNPVKIYILLVFIGITFLSSYPNTCSAQGKPADANYKTLIQQADQALASKDYEGALLLYEKARQAKPEYNYATDKIGEINKLLDASPDTKAQLFENTIIKAENLFKQKDYPQAKAEFQKAVLIDPSAQFPKDRLEEISALYKDPADVANFKEAVANGDKSLAISDFDKAITFYETALALQPNTKLVKDKIASSKKQQADLKIRTEQSAKSIASADILLQAGKRPEARAEYQKALDLTPGNQYAKQKIQEIDNYTSNQKAFQDAYDKSIELADQFYINRDFASARIKYQEALNAKPGARYPKEMLEKTKSGESQLQSDQQKYDAALASAESLLKSIDYPAAIIGFKSALAIKPAETYPKTKIAEVEKLIADNASRNDAFDVAIKNGDQSLSEKKYDAALGYFRNALTLLPNEKYPAQKIDEITAITGKQKETDENYNKSIAEADNLFKQEKFEDAISIYNKSLEFKPGEAYPQQKITEAQAKLAASKNKKEGYAAAIANGDRLFSEYKYNEALEAYELARSINSFSEYPIGKIAEINFLYTKYSKALEKANKALSLGNYDLAIKSFQDALIIKPTDQATQDKITEIKATVAAQLQSDEKYTTAVKAGDQLFTVKEYSRALAAYTEASEVKKNEKYPQDQIAKINKIMGDLQSLDENYSQAVADGDNNYNSQKLNEAIAAYKKASGIKPAETYPKTQIEKITGLLAVQTKLDSDYLAYVTSADKLFAAKKYEDAIVDFLKAQVLNPSEKYPSDKIAEAEKQIIDLKTIQESYNKAIADGDKFFTEKEYVNSLASFKNANLVKPGEAYPNQKIAEIQTILDKDKAEGQRYQEAVAQADKLFNDKKLTEAIEPYQRALKIKPAEKYPQDQIAEINNQIDAEKKLGDDYQKLITDAETFLKAGKYEEARNLFSSAATLKPLEKLPKDKIAEIDGILAAIQLKGQNYSKSISDADAAFAEKKYPQAIVSYNAALILKPSEAYPKSQLEKINGLVSAQTKLDADYTALINSADKLFTAKKYEDAIADYRKSLVLKPSEKYPSDKIAEAEKLIVDIRAIQESYNKAIADGNKLFTEKDYTNSLASFKNANSVKPGEAYPNQKIAEIQTILDKDKAESQRYQEAIAQADKLFNDKKLTEALEPYQRASKIKPAEKYPQDQIAEINRQVAAEKKLSDDYQKAITDADLKLKAGKYDEARNLYSSAGALKPLEKLPKDKIAEIDGILSGIQKMEQNYSKAISDGDASLAAKRYQEALTFYAAASGIKPTETYPKIQAEKINNLLAEQQKLDDNFLTLVTSADQFFDAKKYTEAIVDFRKALALKPTEKYPSDKIAEAEKNIADLKALQEVYEKALADGDIKLASKDYENALISFKTANTSKPTESYPVQKISEIQLIIDKQKAETASYQQALALADKFFSDQKYREALEPYQRASTIKTGEKYPQEQIIRINAILAEQKKLDEDYRKLLTDAEVLLKAAKYDEARITYTNAGTMKPAEKLPKEKIAEIDGILAGIKLKDENYTKAINAAAEFYTAKNLQGAIKSYEEALFFKPTEKYPQERITAIKSEITAIDENYLKAVSLGDSKLAAKNLTEALNAYQNAAEIKPDEEYPKTKIAGINSALLLQKEELEKMYSSYVAEGDRLFGAKDYAGANSSFAKAAGIKPDESYPKQRIIEITKIVEEIELARKAEYNKALGEADKLYNTKVFDLAIDAYEVAAMINPGDSYPGLQIGKIRKYMSEHAIQDLYLQTLVISEGNEKKFTFSAIEPRLRKNNYILLKARSTGKTAPKVYLNYGRDGQKNGGIVLRSIDKATISDYLIRISVQDKWYREDNNWISLSVETGDIEITKVQIAAGE
jgi:tetratricopeptide (TPR) repeat protein